LWKEIRRKKKMANKKADFKLDDVEETKKQTNVKNCWFDDEEGLFHCLMEDGTEWTSSTGSAQDKWKRIPKKGTESPASVSDVTMDIVSAYHLAEQLNQSPWGDLPPTQQKIHEIMGAMKDLLLYKNQKYGDSAINPKKIFYKGDSTNSILIRLDDKLGRVMSNTEEKPRINDVCDIIGYCTLLLISMGVTAEDIAKFKD
jgi:hypothetical protein